MTTDSLATELAQGASTGVLDETDARRRILDEVFRSRVIQDSVAQWLAHHRIPAHLHDDVHAYVLEFFAKAMLDPEKNKLDLDRIAGGASTLGFVRQSVLSRSSYLMPNAIRHANTRWGTQAGVLRGDQPLRDGSEMTLFDTLVDPEPQPMEVAAHEALRAAHEQRMSTMIPGTKTRTVAQSIRSLYELRPLVRPLDPAVRRAMLAMLGGRSRIAKASARRALVQQATGDWHDASDWTRLWQTYTSDDLRTILGSPMPDQVCSHIAREALEDLPGVAQGRRAQMVELVGGMGVADPEWVVDVYLSCEHTADGAMWQNMADYPHVLARVADVPEKARDLLRDVWVSTF